MVRPAAVLLLVALLPLQALAHRPAMTASHASSLGRQYSHPPASENTIKAHSAPKRAPKFPWWFLRRHIAAVN